MLDSESFKGRQERITLDCIGYFQPPLESHLNGKILGYQINLRESNAEGRQWRSWTQKESEPRLLVLRKLHPFTRYEVTVRAFNRIGSGPASPRIIVLTLEGGR